MLFGPSSHQDCEAKQLKEKQKQNKKSLGSHRVTLSDLERRDLNASAFEVLGLQACTTTSSYLFPLK